MIIRIPSSLKWLADKYARRKAKLECIKLRISEQQSVLQSLENSKKAVESEIHALAKVIGIHEVPIEPKDIPTKKTYRKVTQQKYGALTRTIYRFLEFDQYKSTDEVFEFVTSTLNIDFDDHRSKVEFRKAVRYRLKNLCRSGKIERKQKDEKFALSYWKLLE